jgi:hypothetical protein
MKTEEEVQFLATNEEKATNSALRELMRKIQILPLGG